jgi:hypothetical protein
MYQQSIQFFWPLTEQISLDLDYHECEKPKLYSTGTCLITEGAIWTTVATNIAPQLTVTPINSVGQLSIGGINVGMDQEPKWYQKLLYKALGFNWKDKS